MSTGIGRYELCTVFDVNYLTRAVVLARSLAESCGPDGFCLRALCMDCESERLLNDLELPGVVPIGIRELERHDPGFAAVREERSHVEYAWTAMPAICLFALERNPDIDMISYLDADLMFFSDPGPLYDEMSDASIGLTPHRFAPDSMQHLSSGGPYNCGFVMFRRDARGLDALRWWRQRCLEWCYNRIEPPRWGSQRYLEELPERFAGVHIFEHPGGMLAPWNARAHSIQAGADGVLVDGQRLIYHHYSSLALYEGAKRSGQVKARSGGAELCEAPVPLLWRVNNNWPISEIELGLLWRPYVARISEEIARLRQLAPGFDSGVLPSARDFLVVLDATYLPRALAMYRSLTAVSPQFRLWVYCIDETTERVLRKLDLPNIEIVGLSELERDDPELAAVRSTRSQAEYCQTAKPVALLHALARRRETEILTLVDADLYFYGDPTLLLHKLQSGGCIMLVPHRRPRARAHRALQAGEYNTGFVTFRNDPRALDALSWWRERCLEWCYQRVEPGRFTDQRYLHDWPESRSGVEVVRDLGGGVAPWNMHQYNIEDRNGTLRVNGFPLIFVHFQSLRLYRGAAMLRRCGLWSRVFKLTRGRPPVVWTTDPEWIITDSHYELLWHPYVRELARALDAVRTVEPGFDVRIRPPLELFLLATRLSIRAAIRAVVPPPLRRPGYRAYVALRGRLSRLPYLLSAAQRGREFADGDRGVNR